MTIRPQLEAIIAEHHLLEHPFYQAWSAGKLSQDMLATYATQYYQQVAAFPRFISRVHTHCPHMSARKMLLENLVDEEIKDTDHPSLWMQFANGLGVSEAVVKAAIPLPETQALVDTYYQLAEQDWKAGLCALYAYEAQVPAVALAKIAGLKQYYGIEDEATLAFFTAHQIYDVEHANQVATIIDQYVPVEQATQATKQAAESLWGFLDGMCRVTGITC